MSEKWQQGRPARAGLPLAADEHEVVQRHVRAFLDSCAPGTRVQIVSAWAGRGDDVLPILADHPRRADVRVRLIELDPHNVAAACDAVGELKLDWNVEIVCGDASRTDAFVGAVPAGLFLLCGIFDGIDADDTRNTIELLPQLCAPGATVVWTLQRRAAWLIPDIRRWFAGSGFSEEAFESPAPGASVGVDRFDGLTLPLRRGTRLFTFPADVYRPGGPA